MIDPLQRWRPLGDKPDYAGFLSSGGMPLTQDAEHLRGVDVAIVGAPTDDLVSDRPGTRFAPRAIVHFDTHTDTGEEVFGVERSHGTPMFRLVESGAVDGARYAQIGLRGYWPGPEELVRQCERGIAN